MSAAPRVDKEHNMFKKLFPTALMLVALNAGAAFVRDNGAAPTVYDDQNDLTWVESASATGGANVSWANAITTCENLIYAGRDDWRLPNFNELVSLADYTRNAPAINPNFHLSFFGAATTTGQAPPTQAPLVLRG